MLNSIVKDVTDLKRQMVDGGGAGGGITPAPSSNNASRNGADATGEGGATVLFYT